MAPTFTQRPQPQLLLFSNKTWQVCEHLREGKHGNLLNASVCKNWVPTYVLTLCKMSLVMTNPHKNVAIPD